MKNLVTSWLCAFVAFLAYPRNLAAEPIKLGVPVALTGDLAQGGNDIKNALILANELIGRGKYELLFQDDQCSNKEALSISQRFIQQEKVRYTIGFMCNQTLIATAPVSDRSGVYVFSSSGTSGDVKSLGKRNFRFFPPDHIGAERLFRYIKPRHKHVVIISEQTEYTEMMERSFKRFNEESGRPLKIDTEQFASSVGDFRTQLAKIKSSFAEALYINADSDTSYINILKQLDAIKFDKPLYTVYLGASHAVLSTVPELNRTVVFSNLPSVDSLLSPMGKEYMAKFRERFGEPQSGFPVVPTTLESFRMLDTIISQGLRAEEFLPGRIIKDGILPPYSFDAGGNITGLMFEMQHIKDGKVVTLEK